MKMLILKILKMELELDGVENNPNISDGYFGDLDIIKIDYINI